MQISDEMLRVAVEADSKAFYAGAGKEACMRRALEAALSLPVQPVALAAFGFGNLGVDTGTLHDRPAVFVRPLDHAGSVGARLPDDKQIKGPQSAFEPGEFCLTFPTMEQAEAVLNALTTPPVPPTKGPEDDLIAAREVIDWIDAWISNPVGSYSTMALDGLFAMTRDRILALRSRPASALPVVKPLEWRYYADAFPPMWVSQNAAFGSYSIEEAAGSDSPTYDVLNPTMGLMVNVDSLPDAKAAAQADFERRILSALIPSVQP